MLFECVITNNFIFSFDRFDKLIYSKFIYFKKKENKFLKRIIYKQNKIELIAFL
jgi:hypothetical protein